MIFTISNFISFMIGGFVMTVVWSIISAGRDSARAREIDFYYRRKEND